MPSLHPNGLWYHNQRYPWYPRLPYSRMPHIDECQHACLRNMIATTCMAGVSYFHIRHGIGDKSMPYPDDGFRSMPASFEYGAINFTDAPYDLLAIRRETHEIVDNAFDGYFAHRIDVNHDNVKNFVYTQEAFRMINRPIDKF